MRILGVDFETTGLDPAKDRIIEVGAVLWDWDASVPLQLFSALVTPDEVPISPEITALTGITPEQVAEFGMPQRGAIAILNESIRRADYVLAHNGNEFDLPFYLATCARVHADSIETKWLDSRVDVKYPETITVRNLTYLAAEHNFLNPFRHRAVFDVLTMLKVCAQYPLASIIARSMEPTLYVQALVSYDDREKAKARGYYWHGPSKRWWRAFKESDFLAERDTCGFRTAMLSGPLEEK